MADEDAQFNEALAEHLKQKYQNLHDHVAASWAKRLALDLECLLLDSPRTTWWDSGMKTLGDYQAAMREIETYIGEQT